MGKFAHAQNAVLQANYANFAALAATDATLATVATSATQAIESSEANEASLAEVSAALSANEAALNLLEAKVPQLTPIGAIYHFYRASAPDGWLECTGQAVSRTTYADLFAIIGITAGAGDGSTTFNVPDLRDQFLRAWDRSGARALGDEQGDALKAHTHDMDELDSATETAGYGLTLTAGFQDRVRVNFRTEGTPLSTGSTGIPEETRPKNVALLCCIKY